MSMRTPTAPSPTTTMTDGAATTPFSGESLFNPHGMKTRIASLILTLLFLAAPVEAWYPMQIEQSYLPEGNPAPVIGFDQPYMIRPNDTLVELAYHAGVGYEPLAYANPEIDPWQPPKGKNILIPYTAILPLRAEPGIIINIPEYRLYYLWRETKGIRVRIYPIGIGQEGWDTPLGRFSIVSKVRDPIWRVPESIQKERPDQPIMVPPGPDNPLGGYWLGLSIRGYGIHGTHRPLGVGRRVSHGCIRLYPMDIEDLFARVEVKTPGILIYQPAKVGIRDGKLWAEIHRDKREQPANVVNEIIRMKGELEWRGKIDWARVWLEMENRSGVPFVISTPPS
ncbi:MAG: L,D-transpeptidase family protein [Deltaproteobacteria bacterium]|nr:L,D-transpeptidase family protein [Deltaproteobacteria bacterium]